MARAASQGRQEAGHTCGAALLLLQTSCATHPVFEPVYLLCGRGPVTACKAYSCVIEPKWVPLVHLTVSPTDVCQDN